MNRQQAHVFFSGRVQGVFFRAFTQETAKQFGLGGWAKNLPDGRVEALFEGQLEDIEKVIALCTKGPPGSVVNDVEKKWKQATGERFDHFSIRYY